jgi:hypothetical protein
MKFVNKVIRKSNGEALVCVGDTYEVIRNIKLYFLNNKALSKVCLSKTRMCVGSLIGERGRYIVGLGGWDIGQGPIGRGPIVKAYSIQDFMNYFTDDFDYFAPKPNQGPGHTSLNLTYFLPIDKFLQYRTHHKIRPWQHRPGFFRVW